MTVLDSGSRESLWVDIESGKTLPPSWYTSQEIYDLEQERIFRHSWQYVGHTGLLQEVGSYFTARVGDIPVVVVRDKQHNINAFLNICRHRAHAVAVGSGKRSTLQCGYHAWTYDLDGTLRAAPHSKLDPDFDPCPLSLIPVQVDTVGPFVFVNPDVDAGPLSEVLGRMPEIWAEREWDPSGYGRQQVRVYDIGCNWKIYLENTECYHCNVMHPSVAATLDTRPEHTIISEHNPRFWDYTQRPRGINAERYHGDPDKFYALYFAFPNFWLITRNGGFTITMVALPETPNSCRVVTEYWFPNDWDDALIDESFAYLEEVLAEDIVVMERVQQGQRAQVGGQGQMINNLESLIIGFEREVLKTLTGEE